MKKWNMIVCAGAVIVLMSGAGVFFYIRSVMPPGEEWISHQNEEIITRIDLQLEGIDIERIVLEKENLVIEKSITEIQQEIGQGELTYEELTAICLYRIRNTDQKERGLNSVMEVASDAIMQARARDQERRRRTDAGRMAEVSPLFGIPVMLKDNINTADMPTSAGAVAFADYIPEKDAELVTALREQGAVILGKNNLSEFANFVSEVMPGGYSGKKGQTVNPYGPIKISPSGSSSGSAVAVTANLVPVSIGTETAGSIVAPAAANSVVGFKPSRDSVSGDGIFPLIKAVDTAGPICKTVEDAAIAYQAISKGTVSYQLKNQNLNGVNIGLIAYEYNDKNLIERLEANLTAAGADVREVQIDESDVQVQTIVYLTFRNDFETYARQFQLPVTTLDELIAFNRQDQRRRARYGQDLLEAAAAAETDVSQIQNSIVRAQEKLDVLFQEQGLDAVVFINSSASTIVSAAGYPELTVPIGKNKKGVPQGATFAAGRGEDGKLLEIGYAFEQAVGGRITP